MRKPTKPANSQTLLRGLYVLECVAHMPRSIPEIAEEAGISYQTAHRIVSVLTEVRYLRQVDSRLYGLGPKVVELGFAGYQQADVTKIAKPCLTKLAQATSDTVHLARLEDGEVIYLDKLQSRRPIEITSRIGGRKPAVSTGVGKALLLDTPEEELRQLFKRDRHLMKVKTSEVEWFERMRVYQDGGYAYDLGEDEHQIRCVAAPLRDATGRIVAAISVSSTLEYMQQDRMEALIPVVKSTAAEISRGLGFVDSRDV
ncbi:IclR family transcriptional regulator [Celeribacter indicus]|uniref:IclR family transcriptional regulator n=1 Tax=Celeribacter indicus TaxID=1208324 RepID=UPI0008989775|nr:IclR family transcriptional regulator [Celeribacter indicus]SDX44062.1 transcriptional regulator, IclR family [Celeribacter indicus]